MKDAKRVMCMLFDINYINDKKIEQLEDTEKLRKQQKMR